jgi:hypothetical protein
MRTPALIVVAGLTLGSVVEPRALQSASDAHPRGYVCHLKTGSLQIDGRLDDVAWKDVPWTDRFVDIEGAGKPAPALSTRVKMLWDAQYFYVAAELIEPHLWATLTEHDAVIFHDNDFEVFIDPNGDNHEYYEFEINALGTGWDLFLPRPYKDGGKPLNSWEIPGLQSAVHLDGTLNDPRDTDRSWSVELAFPWKVLGETARRPAPPRDGDQWRVNFSRVQWTLEHTTGTYRKAAGTREHNWVWAPQHVIDMHRPESWGYVQFSAGRPGDAAFRPDPALAARQWLHRVYYAQQAYRKVHQRFAERLDALKVPSPSDAALAAPMMRNTDHAFEVSIEWRAPGRTPERWYIRQDSLVWSSGGL